MNIKGKDLQNLQFVINSKGRDFGCFGLAKAEMAAFKEKSGSKLPHSRHSNLQE
jgi:hypothetical protein